MLCNNCARDLLYRDPFAAVCQPKVSVLIRSCGRLNITIQLGQERVGGGHPGIPPLGETLFTIPWWTATGTRYESPCCTVVVR